MITNIFKTSGTEPVCLMGEEYIDIEPGTMAILHDCGRLRTVVGSGISVCLFDRHSRVAGMNHFLLPRTDDLQKATGRYGNAALIGLLNMIEQHGNANSLVAYIAGGAYCDAFEIDSAIDNIRIVWKFLCAKNIPIISQHVGGHVLRTARFDVKTGLFTVNLLY